MSMRMYAQNPHGETLKIDCAQCHTADNWLVDITTIKFNHEVSTEFKLEGTHSQINCKECHSTLIFNEAQQTCISCHQDIHSASVGDDCARCHTSENWIVNNINELHEQNGFPLIGAHTAIDCAKCHTSETSLIFDRIGNECVNCHQKDFDETVNPNHIIADFSTDCTECHDIFSTSWGTDSFNHDMFPLTLGHNIQECKKCHTSNNFADASPECISCHQTDFNDTSDPNHINANFSTDCVACHTTNPDWTPVNWDHNEVYPLNGAHAEIANECATCHKPEYGNYSNTPDTCVGCHLEDYNSTSEPNHSSSQFSTECTQCHTESSWTPSTFNHESFPLTLGHDIENCTECHKTASYSDTSPECISCHQTDFNDTSEPNHINANFSTDCTTCHTTNPDWTPVNWDHNEVYPLNGAHAEIANECATCHKPEYGNYSNTPDTCVGCHLEDYNSTSEPNHSSSQFSTECTECHTESSWTPSTFNHDQFPLTGGHDIENCTECHKTTSYSDTSPECVSCHQSDYDSTTDPNHINAGFSTDCIACHTTGDWTPATFDHDLFPLTGGHDISDCTECHKTANYADTSPECLSCHQSDYDSTTDPNHISAGFSTDCIACHTTGDWTPATFDHDLFPLTGGHDISDCTECHKTANYADTSPECVSCHQTDYDSTTDPNHISAGFSTDCIACHTTGDWTPATFDHDAQYFPIYSGNHREEWNSCIDCHTIANNYSSFSCITCHEHNNKTDVDEDHEDVSDYTYDSDACFRCHPDGSE